MALELFYHRHWLFGGLACRLISVILLLNLYGSVYFLSAISIDRCIAVCFPLKSRSYRTRFYAWTIAITAWVLAMINSSQAIIYRRIRHYAHNSTHIAKFKHDLCCAINGHNQCGEFRPLEHPEEYFEFDMCVWDFTSEEQSRNFLIVKFVFGFVIPFILISYSFICFRFVHFRSSSTLKLH